MSKLIEEARPAIKDLLQADDRQLYEILGIRIKGVALDPHKAGNFSPEISHAAESMGALDDIREFGTIFFSRLNRQCYELVCGEDDANSKERQRIASAFGIGETEVGAAIAAAAVTQLGLAPAIAVVVAALIVKLFFRNAHTAMCQVWKKKVSD